jgi:uncharacterized protein YjbI with pentapeptide repeats
VLLRQVPWRRVLGWFGLLVAAAVVVVAGVYVVFWPVSDLIARHDVGAISGLHRAAALQAARDAARGRLLTFGAGLFAAGALVYTARNFTLSRRTFELTEQGQVTDHYTKAIEQLGSDKLEVRIGGVYALERVAHDSPPDHPTVMEVLAAFVREHSHEQRRSPSSAEPGGDPREHPPRPDLQAAVTVIGRNPGHDRRRVNLAGTYLAGTDFAGAFLAHTDLTDTDLTRADLAGACLTGTTLYRATLTDAYLPGATLTSVNLTDAKLTGVYLVGADLTGANLTGATITGANLTSATLTGATIISTNLTDTDLTGAVWPLDAVVPAPWQRDTGSGRLTRADTKSGGATTDAAPGT